jgi:hypothetical protein
MRALQPDVAGTAVSPAVCPPHHWLISNATSPVDSVERWRCLRCEAVRERRLAQPKPNQIWAPSKLRPDVDPVTAFVGIGGERVG